MGKEARTFCKRIAEKMERKTGQSYSQTISFVRRRIRFDLLKTTVIALRGYRGKSITSEASEISELDLNTAPEV